MKWSATPTFSTQKGVYFTLALKGLNRSGEIKKNAFLVLFHSKSVVKVV